MERNKVTFLKERNFQERAQKHAEFLENQFAQNPIKAKFNAFKKLKKEITIKDLF